MIFIFEIPVFFIIAILAMSLGGGYALITNIDTIVQKIGMFAVAVIIAIIILFVIACLASLIGRKNKKLTFFSFVVMVALLLYGITTYVNYVYVTHDAYYVQSDMPVIEYTNSSKTTYNEYVLPKGTLLISTENAKERDSKSRDWILNHPQTEFKYKDESGKSHIVKIDLNNKDLKYYGEADYFGRINEK